MKKVSFGLAGLVSLVVMSGGVSALAQSSNKEATYIEIPIKGAFGAEVTAAGVYKALNEAKTRNIKHAVFVVDSPGGVVADAMAIEKIMDQFEGDIQYHCVIVKGISASMSVVSGCRDVYMAPGAATGAAVSFSTNVDTGNAEVDAKMNAAWGSQLAARADKHNQPGVLYRAMVEKAAEVWWGKNSDGRTVLAASNAGLTDAEQVDSAERVLALTMDQAVKYGFALPIGTGDGSGLGTILGARPWISAGDVGAKLMKAGQVEVEGRRADLMRSVDEFKKLDADIDEQLKKYNSLVTNPTSISDLRAAGRALEAIKNDQRAMEGISKGFTTKGKAWCKARRIDEALFTQTLEVPKLDIDIKTEQQKLANLISRASR